MDAKPFCVDGKPLSMDANRRRMDAKARRMDVKARRMEARSRRMDARSRRMDEKPRRVDGKWCCVDAGQPRSERFAQKRKGGGECRPPADHADRQACDRGWLRSARPAVRSAARSLPGPPGRALQRKERPLRRQNPALPRKERALLAGRAALLLKGEGIAPNGIRTRVPRMRTWYPRPLDDRGGSQSSWRWPKTRKHTRRPASVKSPPAHPDAPAPPWPRRRIR